VPDRYAMRMRYAVVAVVAAITTAHRRPLLRADGGLLVALAWARDFTAILRFGVTAKEARWARGYRTSGTAAPHGTTGHARCYRAWTLACVSRGHSV